jgi:hypothetical protein
MKAKTQTKGSTKKEKRDAAPPSLGLEDLKALAVKTGIAAGGAFFYTCNHISD